MLRALNVSWVLNMPGFWIYQGSEYALGSEYQVSEYDSASEYSFPANISTLFRRCLLVDMMSRRGTTSNQRWNNAVYFNIGIYNIENVESTLCISTLTWTTLNNVEKTLSFQRRVSQRWSTSKQRCEIDPFRKEQKKLFQIEYNQSFNCYFIVVFTLLPILWGICWRILAKPQKLRSWNVQHCNNLI